MKPFDFATKIVPIELVGGTFVVSLADPHENTWKLALAVGTSQRADHIALIARQIIAGGMARAMKEACFLCAARIDAAYFERQINYADRAAEMCRRVGEAEFRA